MVRVEIIVLSSLLNNDKFSPPQVVQVAQVMQTYLHCQAPMVLKKLMAEQVSIYKRTNVVQSEKFSEKITKLMNSYYNGFDYE